MHFSIYKQFISVTTFSTIDFNCPSILTSICQSYQAVLKACDELNDIDGRLITINIVPWLLVSFVFLSMFYVGNYLKRGSLHIATCISPCHFTLVLFQTSVKLGPEYFYRCLGKSLGKITGKVPALGSSITYLYNKATHNFLRFNFYWISGLYPWD